MTENQQRFARHRDGAADPPRNRGTFSVPGHGDKSREDGEPREDHGCVIGRSVQDAEREKHWEGHEATESG